MLEGVQWGPLALAQRLLATGRLWGPVGEGAVAGPPSLQPSGTGFTGLHGNAFVSLSCLPPSRAPLKRSWRLLPCKLVSPHNGRDEIPYLTGTPDPNATRLPQLCSQMS